MWCTVLSYSHIVLQHLCRNSCTDQIGGVISEGDDLFTTPPFKLQRSNSVRFSAKLFRYQTCVLLSQGGDTSHNVPIIRRAKILREP